MISEAQTSFRHFTSTEIEISVEIVEQGTHQQLLDRGGFSHQLYLAQFKGQEN